MHNDVVGFYLIDITPIIDFITSVKKLVKLSAIKAAYFHFYVAVNVDILLP